ncbi:PC-esterase domain-containing protein 1A-like isoform X1 [Haemaphysalis longicornis]
MPSVFPSSEVRSLLRAKDVVMLGCSNMRAMYKDLVCLYQYDRMISNNALKRKMEEHCLGDTLVVHGKKHNGRDYREERLFCMHKTSIHFCFITRIYSDYIKSILERMVKRPPDVVMVGSCLWDITRWGPDGVKEYKENLVRFFTELSQSVPSKTLVMWVMAAPLAQDVRGGFLIPQLEFLKYSLRFHVLEANYYCREVADRFGFDVVDLHYHLRLLLEHRAEDGIHWLPLAVRLCTNVLLTHVAISWGTPLPKRGYFTEKEKQIFQEEAGATDPSKEGDDTANESLLPADLSYSVIFGDDKRVMKEVINNATEAAPSRPKARRGNWRSRFENQIAPHQPLYQPWQQGPHNQPGCSFWEDPQHPMSAHQPQPGGHYMATWF